MHKINNIHILLRSLRKIVNKKTINLNLSVINRFNILSAFVLMLSVFISCSQMLVEQEVIARVGSKYFYRNDLLEKLNSFEDEMDSILKSRVIIDAWARNQVLLQQSQVNLPASEIEVLEQLIDQYRIDLYANAYRQAVVNERVDTLVSEKLIDSFLLGNKEVFKLKAPLYQVRYIHLPLDNVDQNEIQRSFQRFNRGDKFFLDSLSFQYHSYLLSDSLWLNRNNLNSRIRFLNPSNFNKYIKKSQFFKIEDTLGVYLFFVKEFLEKGDLAPREVLTPTIKNIILNQRKLKYTKQFEKNILQDAIQSKTYEIY